MSVTLVITYSGQPHALKEKNIADALLQYEATLIGAEYDSVNMVRQISYQIDDGVVDAAIQQLQSVGTMDCTVNT